MRTGLIVLLMAAWGCDCGTQVIQRPECEVNPNAAGCKPPPSHGTAPPPVTPCSNGTVTGVVCAPDLMTTVSGATVTVTGTCDGTAFSQTTTTNASGDYTLTLPAGSWTIDITSGSFSAMVPVTVTANQTTNLPVNANDCIPPTFPLAVVSGAGDHIEQLLTTVGFTPTIYNGNEPDGGSATGWNDPSAGGLAFLKDLTEMEKYKVIFIDCAAGRTTETEADGGTSYAKFFFEQDQSTITQNLQAFVANGGSLYASDWAMIFVWMGYSQEFEWDTDDGTITFPFDPYNLMGGPNQTSVSGNVVDASLASYLQSLGLIATTSTPVTISFPSAMSHWGFLKAVNSPATVLISGSVGECTCPSGGCTSANNPCKSAAAAQTDVPLAALYRTASPGGAVAYTSFHNIDQTNAAQVEGILKYIVFKL